MKKFTSVRNHFLHTKDGRAFIDGLLHAINHAFSIISDDIIGSKMVDVLCLGLGNPAADRASLRQLVVLDLLIDLDPRLDRSRTRLYDPVFKSVARQLIRKLDMKLIYSNQEACYELDSDRYHFIMLPHCAPALLNNLLYTNWNINKIKRLILYSNDWYEIFKEFGAMGESDELIRTDLAYLNALKPVIQIPSENFYLQSKSNGKLEEYQHFENMRIQYFKLIELKNLPITVWNKPPYSNLNNSNNDYYPKLLAKPNKFYSDLIDQNTVANFIDPILKEETNDKDKI